MSIPHPIPYQGSKRSLAKQILQYIPDNTTRLIEPFAGSAAISLAAAYHGKVHDFILNDINAPLMTLWQMIINHHEQIARYYNELWQAQSGRERTFYDIVRDRFNSTYRPHYFLYLLARCVKAAIRYNSEGAFNQSPDNRRKGRQPKTMAQDIQKASQLLHSRTRIISTDYAEVVSLATATDVIYMDPPYEGVCANRDPRYIIGTERSRFVKTLEELNQRGISFLVSYDGRTGKKTFGRPLPDNLKLTRLELDGGRSSQATLLGRTANTVESLYLSSALIERLQLYQLPRTRQLALFGELA
jgi:DNA adenine methylase